MGSITCIIWILIFVHKPLTGLWGTDSITVIDLDINAVVHELGLGWNESFTTWLAG